MSALQFRFQDMLNELGAFSELASNFLEPDSRSVLPQLRSSLEGFRNERTDRIISWGISEDRPLRTRVSDGEYESGKRKGSDAVYAVISSQWEIKKVPQRKKGPEELFHLTGTGIASTRIKIMSCRPEGDPVQVAMWRMEIADMKSPGCYFHVQILGDNAEPPFPRSLTVPRLPSIILTPTAVIDYVLAELFQSSWPKHVIQHVPQLQRWAPIQKKRMIQLLKWKIEMLGAQGSPWINLKSRQPRESLFVE